MTYEYQCAKCGDTYTMERKMSDPEEIPQCNLCHKPMNRVWSSPTVVFNASGFYSTDNKRG